MTPLERKVINMTLQKDMCAIRPPMGWNSWDCYGAVVEEHQLLKNAEYMAQRLKPHGYEYIVCDIQWAGSVRGLRSVDYYPFTELSMDEYGRLLPSPVRFPSSAGGAGFSTIAQSIHALGLKFGIHIMRGVPRQAVHARRPILGTDCTADQIALPNNICFWNGDMYGLNCEHPAAQAYYNSIFRLYASWGVDFVKVDDICRVDYDRSSTYAAWREVELIRSAIDNCGRDMVLSLSPGPASIEDSWHLSRYANMWRITDDFWDRWELLKPMFRRCEIWQRHVAPGRWPDCDMLPLGRLCLHQTEGGRPTGFTADEQRTMLTLWSVFRSPLMLGCELTLLDGETLSLISNDEVIAVNQRGSCPRLIAKSSGSAVWVSDTEDGAVNAALFNLSDERAEISLNICDVGLAPCARVRDLWRREDKGIARGEVTASLPAHGSALYKLRAVE